jgi:hypothetical protein
VTEETANSSSWGREREGGREGGEGSISGEVFQMHGDFPQGVNPRRDGGDGEFQQLGEGKGGREG